MKLSKKYKRKLKKVMLTTLSGLALISVILTMLNLKGFTKLLSDNVEVDKVDSDEVQNYVRNVSKVASQNNRAVPSDIALSSNAQMASSISASHALYANGVVTSWGTNSYGLLGNGNTTGTTVTYSEVSLIDSGNQQVTDAIGIAAAYQHAMVLREDGTVWAWGRNNVGQLGNATTTTGVTAKAQQVKRTDNTVLDNIVKIEVGNSCSYALDSDGNVWSWGIGTNGQLGNGKTANSSKANYVLTEDGEALSNIVDIQAGLDICIAITSDKKVYAWGQNAYGEFGNGTTDRALYAIPLDITDWKKISVKHYNVGVLKNDGSLWTAGERTALGYDIGEDSCSNTFQCVKTNKTTNMSNVTDFEYSAASLYITVANNKYVYYCGDHHINESEGEHTLYPEPIKNMDGTYFEKNLLKISRQTYDTDFFIGKDGIIYTFGYNGSATMYKYDKVERYYVSIPGEATERIRTERMLVGETKELNLQSADLQKGINLYNLDINSENFEYIMYDTELATISSTGAVTAKKSGIAKGLVTDTKTGYSMEIAIIIEDTYAQIEIGGAFSAELDEYGSVYTWGMNYYGDLGIGGTIVTDWNKANAAAKTNFNRVKINSSTNLENIVKIAVAEEGALALDSDGNVWGWGINAQGQLATGNTSNQSYAKLIYSGENAVDIATSRWSSTILLNDGSVYTTGSNRYGALANTTTTGNITSFTLAEKYEKIVKIGNSYTTMAGLNINGEVFTTGGDYISTEGGYTNICVHGDGKTRTVGEYEPIKANLENVVDFKTNGYMTIAKTRKQ